MTPRDLARSTPFRLTLRLVAIFAAAMLTCFAAAFLVIRSYLDGDLHTALAQDIAAWQADSNPAEIRDRLRDYATTATPATTLVVFLGNDGTRIANIDDFGPVTGFRVVPAEAIPADPAQLADSYLVSSGPVAGGVLILGRDREKVSELGEIFLLVFLFGAAPTLALAAGLGFVTAQATRRRVEALSDTLTRLTTGDLDARVPVQPGRDDDLDRIGADVNRMAAVQSAATASLRQVSADIAHDLKTPIQRVSVLLDLLEGAGPLTDAQDTALARARAETRQIAATFQSLLQIAQLEGGGARAQFGPVDLAEVVADIADVYAPAAEESGHRIFCSVPDRPVVLRGERNLLGQIVANLIENAVRHTPAGGRITVALDQTGCLSISDDGPGIPEAERANVLRRLYRLERSRTTEGSGLGLSLVAAIAELHDARLTLSDARPGLRVAVDFSGVSQTDDIARAT